MEVVCKIWRFQVENWRPAPPANKNRQIAVKPATVIKDISGSLHLVGGSNAAGDMLPVTVKKTYAKLR